MAFNKITDTLNVHQLRADRPIEDASTLKALYDQDVNTVKTRFNEHIDELADATSGSSGADNIGINAIGVVASNVNDAVAEVQANVALAVGGSIPNNTITEDKMVANMKKQAGGVAEYDTVAGLVSDITTNSDNITIVENELDILRTAKDSTGSLNAYILDTPAVFDYNVDGNLVNFNPNFTNTGPSTIAIDGTTKAIKKFDYNTSTYVSLESGDMKESVLTALRYDISEACFVFTPTNNLYYGTSATPPTGLPDGSLYIQYTT